MIVGASDDWEKHQRREINRFLSQIDGGQQLGKLCSPAYPGSMLFNQIAVSRSLSEHERQSVSVPRFESLNAVYASLGYTESVQLSDNTVLIDCQQWWSGLEEVLFTELEALVRVHDSTCCIALLSGRYNANLVQLCNRLSLEHTVVKPDWRDAASQLFLYRASCHTVFVDTARALDAAMIGLECSLIAGPDYSRNSLQAPLFNALLQLPCCRLRRESAQSQSTKPADLAVIENSAEALQAMLGLQYNVSGTREVIRTGVFWQQVLKRRLANLNVATRRKTRKLVEDPRAFFTDSWLPGSGVIASLIPERKRLQGPIKSAPIPATASEAGSNTELKNKSVSPVNRRVA